jgi:hypothetical protein
VTCDPDLENVTEKFFADSEEKILTKEALDDELAELLWSQRIELLKK